MNIKEFVKKLGDGDQPGAYIKVPQRCSECRRIDVTGEYQGKEICFKCALIALSKLSSSFSSDSQPIEQSDQ